MVEERTLQWCECLQNSNILQSECAERENGNHLHSAFPHGSPHPLGSHSLPPAAESGVQALLVEPGKALQHPGAVGGLLSGGTPPRPEDGADGPPLPPGQELQDFLPVDLLVQTVTL